MPKEIHQKKEIQSSAEIPAFSSEEEEFQFWDTHTLGDDFLDSMGPLSEDTLPIDRSRILRQPSAVKAEKQTVVFFGGLKVDGYRMPDGEFRVGISSASEVLGYGREWLGRVLSRDGNTLKALRGLGFTEEIQKVATNSGRPPETLNLRDFNRLISYAVFDGKKAALALQLALTEVALNDFFRDAFGEPPLSINEKRTLFYESYARTISPEQWRQMDREEIVRLALVGDEPQAREGLWNQ